jgi:hypothetical protein
MFSQFGRTGNFMQARLSVRWVIRWLVTFVLFVAFLVATITYIGALSDLVGNSFSDTEISLGVSFAFIFIFAFFAAMIRMMVDPMSQLQRSTMPLRAALFDTPLAAGESRTFTIRFPVWRCVMPLLNAVGLLALFTCSLGVLASIDPAVVTWLNDPVGQFSSLDTFVAMTWVVFGIIAVLSIGATIVQLVGQRSTRITMDPTGFTIQRLPGRARRFAWEDIQSIIFWHSHKYLHLAGAVAIVTRQGTARFSIPPQALGRESPAILDDLRSFFTTIRQKSAGTIHHRILPGVMLIFTRGDRLPWFSASLIAAMPLLAPADQPIPDPLNAERLASPQGILVLSDPLRQQEVKRSLIIRMIAVIVAIAIVATGIVSLIGTFTAGEFALLIIFILFVYSLPIPLYMFLVRPGPTIVARSDAITFRYGRRVVTIPWGEITGWGIADRWHTVFVCTARQTFSWTENPQTLQSLALQHRRYAENLQLLHAAIAEKTGLPMRQWVMSIASEPVLPVSSSSQPDSVALTALPVTLSMRPVIWRLLLFPLLVPALFCFYVLITIFNSEVLVSKESSSDALVALGLVVLIIIGLLIVAVISAYRQLDKEVVVTANDEGVTVRVGGQDRSVRWQDISNWQTKPEPFLGNHHLLVAGEYRITWKEYTQARLIDLPTLRGSKAQQAYLERAAALHAVITARTNLHPRTVVVTQASATIPATITRPPLDPVLIVTIPLAKTQPVMNPSDPITSLDVRPCISWGAVTRSAFGVIALIVLILSTSTLPFIADSRHRSLLEVLFSGVFVLAIIMTLIIRPTMARRQWSAMPHWHITADAAGLEIRDAGGSARLRWDEIQGWAVERQSVFTTYRVFGAATTLIWTEWDLFGLDPAVAQGKGTGRRAFKRQTTALHAMIAARTGKPLRQW